MLFARYIKGDKTLELHRCTHTRLDNNQIIVHWECTIDDGRTARFHDYMSACSYITQNMWTLAVLDM